MEEEKFSTPEAAALYAKAEEIRELVEHILAAAPEGGSKARMLQIEIDHMQADARTLVVKIVGAEAAGLYDLRMENAAIIRKTARELVVGLRGLEMFGYDEQGYFDLLRAEMEEFRVLFVAWVRSFDLGNYIVDRWGLFNPPGVDPDDEQDEEP